jgi:uncharacterized protein (TIGR03437 family)
MSPKAWTLALVVGVGAAWAQPVLPAGQTLNAADYSRSFAPGAYITIFGSNLAPGLGQAAAVPLPTEILGTSVEVTDGSQTGPIPLLYVTPGQLAGQLPYGLGPNVQVRVRTPAGESAWDALTLASRAPRLFAVNQEGFGRAVALDQNWNLAARQNPIKPGQWVALYANSLGAVEPPVPAGHGAGDGSPGKPYNLVPDDVQVTIAGRPAQVGWAGLTPYVPGVYQLNVFTPYWDLLGDLPVRVTAGGGESQLNLSLPAEPNGFYYVMGAGKFPNGQTRTGVGGAGSAIAFRHETREVWGDEGLNAWTLNSRLGSSFTATSGLALTLRQGTAIVYDNNGIEDGTHGGYYDNSGGAVADNQKPGLFEWFSMSNNLNAAFAGYFRLAAPATFDQIIGYFDGNGTPELRFDPANVYNRFRMNIWSQGPAGAPAVNGFTGDVFSSDTAAGTFSYSMTGAARVFSDGARDPIYRMVYALAQPVTLAPGEYWFCHDAAVPVGIASPITGTQQRAISSAVRALPAGKVVLGR